MSKHQALRFVWRSNMNIGQLIRKLQRYDHKAQVLVAGAPEASEVKGFVAIPVSSERSPGHIVLLHGQYAERALRRQPKRAAP
jgi:hypothetical protein